MFVSNFPVPQVEKEDIVDRIYLYKTVYEVYNYEIRPKQSLAVNHDMYFDIDYI